MPPEHHGQQSTVTEQTGRVGIVVSLRQPQVDFLTRPNLAISHAFALILDEEALLGPLPKTITPTIVRQHLYLSKEHTAYMQAEAGARGVSRSDIARRLIDKAMAREQGRFYR